MSIQICNTSPERFFIRRSYNWGGLEIPACPADKPFVSAIIHDQMDERIIAQDHWAEHSEHVPFPVPAEQVVKDFVANEKLLYKGCFLPAGEIPTEAEIAKAKVARRAYMEECVRNGDAAYSINARIDDIPGEWKRACQELKVKRDWAFYADEQPQTIECPVCAEVIRAHVAVCKSCGAILDKEKAAKYGIGVEEKEPVKRQAKEATRVI